MPLLRNSQAALKSYRLGYSPQRPYPWRWTTPLALSVLLTIAAFLTCLNVPLSAYETVQESTYFPNATLPALPMSNIIPSFLRSRGATFAPQTLHVGDTFRLNNSIWIYTIVNAFDGTDNRSKPVTSFPYFNNPFSDSCDVTNFTVKVTWGSDLQSTVTGLITCTQPTVFQMTWGAMIKDPDMLSWVLPFLMSDLGNILLERVGPVIEAANLTEPTCSVTGMALPSCNETDLSGPPCSTKPARFIALDDFIISCNNNTLIDLLPGTPEDYFGSGHLSELNDAFQNLFQVYYHLVRRDLGIILPNNIYLSPEMFNNSITGPKKTDPGPVLSYASLYRAQTSNETVMAQWRETFAVFNETDRVPVLQYLRPVPRLKPLGSAITSVFVATFAMVSTAWTIFSVVAKAFVNSTDNESETIAEKESFDVPLHRAKSSFEGIEPTESSSFAAQYKDPRTPSFTAPYKDPTYADHRWNILVGEVARLANIIENTLPDVVERMERIERDHGEGGE
ncbi:hypothetical protein C8R47DRAFT_1227923 [Mycena vitilis]|nr:hypothetical protein C8R47DRAFT_1227923 [Mycena vitilis]